MHNTQKKKFWILWQKFPKNYLVGYLFSAKNNVPLVWTLDVFVQCVTNVGQLFEEYLQL